MSWAEDDRSVDGALATKAALEMIHGAYHLAFAESDAESRLWSDAIEEQWAELERNHEPREIARAMMTAGCSLLANYEGLGGLHHREMIAGIKRSITDYIARQN